MNNNMEYIIGVISIVCGGAVIFIGANLIAHSKNNELRESVTIIKEIKSASGVVLNTNGNQTIYLPENEVELQGDAMSDKGSIVAYMWVKVSGPPGFVYNPIGKRTKFGGLIIGTYVMKFRATDQYGNEGETTVIIDVKPPFNNDEMWRQQQELIKEMKNQ